MQNLGILSKIVWALQNKHRSSVVSMLPHWQETLYNCVHIWINTNSCFRLTFTKSETRDSIQEATTSLFQRGGTLNQAVSVIISNIDYENYVLFFAIF